ncbi:MAG: hypothetical protein Q9171_005177 [Xanthocarpia ochracea]
MADLQGRKVFKVFNQDFIVDERYNVTKELGQGAYGIVCAATNNQTGEGVAIKKVTNVFSKKILAKRALREIKLLQHFRGHRNITCLYDMDIPRPDNFNETYLYEELMECDLAAIIRSGQPLTDAHFQSFIYQILCGLKYIHSANVLHRDLKPGNLLVNADCELKICDFGLARGFSMDPEENAGYMTEYVATRWYRAPEIMLSFQSYTKAIDVWSVGCILAELLGGRPFFKGRDYVDQLNQILHYLGTPNEETLSRIGSPRAQEYVRNLPLMPKVPFQRLFNNANPDALDLLDRMLAFDPSSRISVEEALEHRYLHIWHDASDEPNCPTTFDFHFEVVEDVPEMRKMILAEVQRFRQYVRVQQTQAQTGGPMFPTQSNVPIPDNAGQWSQEDPRPQEASAPHHTQNMGLEQELQGGLDAMHQVVMTLVPQGSETDCVRTIPLSPSANSVLIGRASKTPSKGLVAAPANAWFDSPIMSRQHGKISITSSGVVSRPQDDTLASSNTSHRSNYKIYPPLMELGSITSAWQQTKPVIFTMEISSPSAPHQQESPTSSSSKSSGGSGFRVPDDHYESLSDDSDASDCEIVDSHPRTFYVPSSGDELDGSEDDSHATAISKSKGIGSFPGNALTSYRSSHIGSLWDNVGGQKQPSRTESQVGSAVDPIKVDKAPRLTDNMDDDTEDEEPTRKGLLKEIGLGQGAGIDSGDRDFASPYVEIPDTITSLDVPIEESLKSHEVMTGQEELELEPQARAPRTEMEISGKQTNQGEEVRYHLGNHLGLLPTTQEVEDLTHNRSDLGVQQPAGDGRITVQITTALSMHEPPTVDEHESSPEPEQYKDLAEPAIKHAEVHLGHGDSLSSEPPSPEIPPARRYISESESEDDGSLSDPAPVRKDAAPAMASGGSNDWSSSMPKSLYLPPEDPFVPRFAALSNTHDLPSFDPPRPTNPHTASLDTQPAILKHPWKVNTLDPYESISKTARAPSPSDAALARKAPSCLDERYHPSVADPPLDDLTYPGASSNIFPWRDTTSYPTQENSLRSASAYAQEIVDYPYARRGSFNDTQRDEPYHYQQGPFSRSYGSFHWVAIPSAAQCLSPSPPPQAPQKSCLVRLKVDAKTVNEESHDLCLNLDETKSRKVDISNLVNPHADSARGLKRKSDQMSSEEPLISTPLATSEPSFVQTVGEDDLGPHAQVRDTVMAGNETDSQGLASVTSSFPASNVANAAEEGPARKKTKISKPKAGSFGKFVSGICLGLAGAFAAFIAATPADVWDEALCEASKLT